MRYLLTCYFLLLFSNSYAQDSLGFYWNRVIGGSANDVTPLGCTPAVLSQTSSGFDFTQDVLRRPDLQIASNGRLIMVSITWSKDGDLRGLRQYADTANNKADVLVTCLDSTGRIIWKKCLGGSNNDFGTAAFADVDGYLIAGSTTSGDGDFTATGTSAIPFLVKMDFNGNILWKKTYPQGSSADMIDSRVEAVKKLPTGNYLMLLNRSSAYLSNSKFTTELMQTDNVGNYANLSVFSGNRSIVAAGMVVRDDGSVLLGGTTAATTGPIITPNGSWVTGYLAKLQFNGSAYSITWIKYPWAFNNSSHTRLMDIVQTRDGSIYLPGTGFSFSNGEGKGILFKYDSSGNFKWTRDYSSFFHRVIYAVDTAGNNGVLFSAFSDGVCAFNYNHVVIGRVDSVGLLLWQKCSTGDNDDYGLRVRYISETAHYVLAVTNSTILPSHTYNKRYIDIAGNMVCPSDLWLIKSGPGNLINGTIFLDLNNNNIQNTGEPLLPNLWVRTGKDTIRTKGVFTYSGRFTIVVDTGRYHTNVLLPAGVPFTIFPSPDSHTFNTVGNSRTIAFAVKPSSSIYDLDINVSPISPPRLNRDLAYKITARNMGSLAISSNTISLVKDPRLSFVSATPAPAQVVGDTLKWNYSSFPVLSEQGIFITFHTPVPPLLNIGDTLRLLAKVQHTQTDATPVNNSKKIEQIIIGPVDPNDKQEGHNGKLTPTAYTNGEYLDYLINFQNMGTDTAFYVEIRDTLNARLDISTIQMIASSHPCVLSVTNNNQLTWKFNTIRLSALSQNADSSKGFIAFRVKPVSGLSPGDSIKNNAAIYFEYNAPVITNTTVTKLTTLALPVKLVSLSALPINGKYISISWKTASEINHKGFEVERSTDAVNFKKISWSLAFNQAPGLHTYSIDDYSVEKNTKYYYRLKVVSVDNDIEYSPVTSACLCGYSSRLIVTPNPGNGLFNIAMAGIKGEATVSIYNSNGKVYLIKMISTNGTLNELVDIRHLPPGAYIISVANNNETNTQILLKN